MLRPHDAVDRLRRRVPDGAPGEGLLRRLRCALVALRLPALDQLDLAVVAGRAGLDQRHVRRQAEPVHVVPGGAVVQRIQHQLELLEEAHAVVGAEIAK